MKENVVYMLRCSNDYFYTGWTNDFIKRMSAHQKGTGANYTRAFVPRAVVYVEVFETKSEAMKKEALIKKMTRSQKEEMIQHHEERTRVYLNNHPFEFKKDF